MVLSVRTPLRPVTHDQLQNRSAPTAQSFYYGETISPLAWRRAQSATVRCGQCSNISTLTSFASDLSSIIQWQPMTLYAMLPEATQKQGESDGRKTYPLCFRDPRTLQHNVKNIRWSRQKSNVWQNVGLISFWSYCFTFSALCLCTLCTRANLV